MTLDDVYDKVGELIRDNATHRSGVAMATVKTSTAANHLLDEVMELQLALALHEGEESKEELCDVFGVVLHLMHILDLSPDEVYRRCTTKFAKRFT